MTFFPFLVVVLALGSLSWFLWQPNYYAPGLAFFALYIFPLLCFRIHKLIVHNKEGISYLVTAKYSPWWGSHQIQQIYIAFPALETFIRLIPGAFSVWLRLWGSKVGSGIYWTPALEITDRNLLEIGDHVIFGHNVGLYCHVIKPKNDQLLLFVRKIRIGSQAFIGAGARLGPGVRVEAGALVPTASDHFPNSRVQ
jgi:hypothetical protein